MTKDEALKKYKETILENDRLGLGEALVAKMNEDKLVEFAVSGFVQKIYKLEAELIEYENLNMSYEKANEGLHGLG
jgi:hypothetical protein